MRRAVVSLAVALVLAGAPLAARAQEPPATAAQDTAQAREHFARGVRMYQEDDFRGALIEFNRAYELSPNWAVLYNVGQSQYQLRDYAGALHTLEKYLDQGGDAIAQERRTEVTRELAELRGRVARVRVVADVDDVDVTVDDVPLGKASATEIRLVGEGRHRVTASRPGFVSVTRVIDLAGGDAPTIRLDLSPAAPRARVVHSSASYGAVAVTGIVGVAGIAVGSVFGVLTIGDHSTLGSECGASKVCPSKAQSDIDAYSRNGTISGVGFGFGAVSLAVAGYLFLHERSREEPASVSVEPLLGPTGAGISGRF